MEKNKILNKYQGLVLGDYCGTRQFFVDDFKNFEGIRRFIGVLESREADFTQAGINFIKEYYGIENLARMLHEDDPEFPGKSIEENIRFLNSFKPFA